MKGGQSKFFTLIIKQYQSTTMCHSEAFVMRNIHIILHKFQLLRTRCVNSDFILSAELNIVTEKHRRLLVEQCGRKQEMEYEVRIRKGTTTASTEREVRDCLEG